MRLSDSAVEVVNQFFLPRLSLPIRGIAHTDTAHVHL
jgi:hypothetical protein